jgi:hypothetical protein
MNYTQMLANARIQLDPFAPLYERYVGQHEWLCDLTAEELVMFWLFVMASEGRV